jgi:anaerobic selenocysteine-containing dehydrogenase
MSLSEERIQAVHTYCAQSKSRCGVVCTVRNGIFEKVEPDGAHPNGCICVKGTAGPQIVYSAQRLKYPMKRTRPKGDLNPGWVQVTWEEALELAAGQLLRLRENYGAESVVFGRPAPGGSAANDYVGWLMRMANVYGSPNVMATTHICNWHKDTGSSYTYGFGIPSPDFERTNLIVLWGHNPEASWPAHAKRVTEARRRGAKLVIVDPRETNLARKADLWLRVRPGTDGALALAFLHVFFEEHLFDERFVREWTNGPFLVRMDTGELLLGEKMGQGKGYVVWDQNINQPRTLDPTKETPYRCGISTALFEEYRLELPGEGTVLCKPVLQLLRELVKAYSPERAAEITWVSAEQIRRGARLLGKTKPASYYTYVGIEEHTNAMQTNRAISILYGLTGNLDTRGGNMNFPRIPTNPITGREYFPKEKAALRLGYVERPLGPAGTTGNVQAYEVYKAILTGKPYPVKGLVFFGGNPLLSNGDSLKGREALKRVDFYLHVDMFSNPGAELAADLLLPASTSWESEGLKTTFEMGESTCTHVHLRQPVVAPLHGSRPDITIIFQLACRMGLGEQFWSGDTDAAFNYQLAPSGLTVSELRERPIGITVPMPVRERKYTELDSKTGEIRGFKTPSRRLEIFSSVFAKHGYDPLPVFKEPAVGPVTRPDLAERFPLILTCSKLIQFCHTQHRQIPMLRKQVPDPFVELHPDTAARLRIADGEWVEIETPSGQIRLKAKITTGIDPRVVSTQHGWWEPCHALDLPGYDPFSTKGANINMTIGNDELDPISGSVPHRSYLCAVRKILSGSVLADTIKTEA